MKFPKRINFVLSFFLLISCSESLDFNQIDDYVAKPVFTSALTYFTAVPAKFFDSSGTIQQNDITDDSEFEGFQNSFIRENVVKIVFNAEMKNEFDRDVTIHVDFLNENNTSVYSFAPIFVESNTVNPPPYVEEVLIASNSNILNTTQVRIRAELENTGTQMNPNDTSEFEFKSSVTFYIESEL